MTILAIDTSSRAASCALLRDGVLAGEFFIDVQLTHSQTILPMVQSLLANTGIPMAQVDLLAVSGGPGSFTGLRIGIAAVKGMAMAVEKPCVLVSTLESLAWNLAAFTGVIVPVMDARRAQVYTAAFTWEGGRLTRQSPDAALSVDALRQTLAPSPAPVMLVGDGAQLCKEHMADLAHITVAPAALLHQRAASVALVAAGTAPSGRCSAAALAPAYLRLPQAERERLARLER